MTILRTMHSQWDLLNTLHFLPPNPFLPSSLPYLLFPVSRYVDYWDPSWPPHEPRTPNYNLTKVRRSRSSTPPRSRNSIAHPFFLFTLQEERVGHHGRPGNNDLLTDEAGVIITDIFKNRWCRYHPCNTPPLYPPTCTHNAP